MMAIDRVSVTKDGTDRSVPGLFLLSRPADRSPEVTRNGNSGIGRSLSRATPRLFLLLAVWAGIDVAPTIPAFTFICGCGDANWKHKDSYYGISDPGLISLRYDTRNWNGNSSRIDDLPDFLPHMGNRVFLQFID